MYKYNMRYSQLLGKTTKSAPKDETSLNAQLLIRGGFVQKEIAGVYAFLPLGKRVLDKIIQVIREEMNVIGGQEILLGSLQNPEIWQKTNRWANESVDIWFRTALSNGTELGLAHTHEEPLTQLLTHYISSYKDLPVYPYQFQTKFRNELRARSGLLRTREFVMKDLYSFDADEAGLEGFYEKAQEAYKKIFNRLGIGDRTYLTFASGGTFAKYSHEFQTVCENGEDTIYLSRKKGLAINKEVYNDEVLADLGLKKDELEEVTAIEVGNIFKLKTKYSEPLGLLYTDENGKQRPVVMGSYGIGPARCMATVVELCHDEKGILWPEEIAPYKVHLVGLNLEDTTVAKKAEETYKALVSAGIEVLFDDRIDATAGQKFADVDLIGIPWRVVVSVKTGGKLEVKRRSNKEGDVADVDSLLKNFK